MYATREEIEYVKEAFKATVEALKTIHKRLELIENFLELTYDVEDTVDNDTLQDKMLAAVISIHKDD